MTIAQQVSLIVVSCAAIPGILMLRYNWQDWKQHQKKKHCLRSRQTEYTKSTVPMMLKTTSVPTAKSLPVGDLMESASPYSSDAIAPPKSDAPINAPRTEPRGFSFIRRIYHALQH